MTCETRALCPTALSNPTVVDADGTAEPSRLRAGRSDPRGRAGEVVHGDSVTEPAKVMRIGSMVKQLLEEVRSCRPRRGVARAPRRGLRAFGRRAVRGPVARPAGGAAHAVVAVRARRGPERGRAARREGAARRMARGSVPRDPGEPDGPAVRRTAAAATHAAAGQANPQGQQPGGAPQPPQTARTSRSGIERAGGPSHTRVIWAPLMADSFTHLHVHTEFSMLDGASRLDEMVAKAVEDGQPAIGMTDHGNMYGTLDFYKECNSQGIKPIIGTEAYMAHDHRSERPSRRGRVDDSGGETAGRQQALLPPDPAGGEQRGVQEPHPALVAGVHGGLLLQAPDGLGVAREVLRRADRHQRLPRRPCPAVPAERRRGRRAREGGPAAGHLRSRQLLHRDPGPRHPGAARDQPEAARDREEDQGAAARHERQPLHAPARPRRPRRTAVRADRLVDVRSRSGSSSRAATTTSRPPPRCAICSARSPRRATTACGSPNGRTSRSSSASRCCPNFPLPDGFADDEAYLRHLTQQGAEKRWGKDVPARGGRTPRLRAAGHLRHGFRVVLPHHVGPDQARPRQQHPGRPGPWFGCRLCGGLLPVDHRPRPDRVRPAVRTVPQPEPHLDARHRHGLRDPLPRRDDPLRRRAVRP